MTLRQEKVARELKQIAAEFLKIEANPTPLITVTGCSVSPDLKNATVFVTAMPDGNEDMVMNYLKRKQGDLRTYAKRHATFKTFPFFKFEIDQGELNRQKIDELLNNS